MLTEILISNNISELRQKISQIMSELDELGEPVKEIPEIISSSNLLRSNEFLLKSDEKKTALLSIYAQYCKSLEQLLSSVFEIQHDLKNILTEQSSMIESKPKSKPKSK
ncbi:MAG: hypothetical protein HOA48_03875, partial [Nitrosopumilus sp.]|nr:hypothetical protein [Nitrosopumilus sp.]MBT6807460.1 hypothetical protein [Nitrosopumilus sp.]